MRVCSATHFLILPSVICCEMFSGLPISATCFSTTCRSSSRAPAGMSSGETHIGRMEATCSATLRANSLNSGVRATKSVSQLTSTSTPTRPLKCTYASISPSVAALALFLAARAWPLSLRTFLAPSTSPSDSSSARFTSIIPAAVSSRSCLIFSIVLAKAPTSLRSFCPALPLRRARHLLSQALPPQAPRRLQARRPQHRWPRPLVSQSRRPRPQNPAPLRRRTRPCLQARPQHLLQVRLPIPLRLLARRLLARHWSRPLASRLYPPPTAAPRRPPGNLRSPAAHVVRRPALPRHLYRR